MPAGFAPLSAYGARVRSNTARAAAFLFLTLVWLCGGSAAASVTSYSLPATGYLNRPGALAAPDGSMFFWQASTLVRMAANGASHTYSVGLINSAVLGPDGAFWFTTGTSLVGRLASDGTVRYFNVPSGAASNGIASGSDGAVWFGEESRVGRVAMDGTVTEYAVPAVNPGIFSMTLAADGNVWFTECSSNAIGKITPQGAVTEYPVSTSCPNLIKSGPDGLLWFTTYATNEFFEYDLNGNSVRTIYGAGGDAGYAFDTAGQMWGVTSSATSDVARLSQSSSGTLSVATLFPFPGADDHTPNDPAYSAGTVGASTDGSVWLVAADFSRAYRIVAPALMGAMAKIYPVATKANFGFFSRWASTEATQATDYSASVNWGDGSSMAATNIQGAYQNGEFQFGASHTWSSAGTYNLTVSVQDSKSGQTYNETQQVAVAKLPPTSAGIPMFSLSAAEMTIGPDGAMWFAAGHQLGRMDALGNVTYLPLTNQSLSINGLATGPDGNLWFTDWWNSVVGKVSLQGVEVDYPLPPQSFPWDLVTGPDGAMWVAGSQMFRVTTAGAISSYSTGFGAVSIAVGSDNALWTMDQFGSAVAKVTTSGAVTRYPVGRGMATGACHIVRGPDGAMWFARLGMMGRITTAGALTWFPTLAGDIYGLAVGADARIYFTDRISHRIGRISTSGAVSYYQPSVNYSPYDDIQNVALGPDSNLWFTGDFSYNNVLGKLVLHKPSGTTTANLTVTHNVVFTAQVGSFTDAETVTPANFTARVSWGDGTSSVATVQMTGSAPRTFTVNASHTYANAGTYKARVYVSEPGIKYSWSKGFGVTVN